MSTNEQQRPAFEPVLGDFVPLAYLWEARGASKQPFQSECSARWFIRANREALIQARAIAQHAGRLLVHPVRFEKVAERIALKMVRRPTGQV